MNKGFLKIALLSAMCASMPFSFYSCKDYDDDIDGIHQTDAGLQKQLNDLDALLKSYQQAASDAAAQAAQAAAAAQATGDAAAKAAAEAKQEAALAQQAAAEAQAEAIKQAKANMEAALKGYATSDQLKDLVNQLAALGKKVDDIKIPGAPDLSKYDTAIKALQTQVQALENYKALLENLKGKEELINKLEQTISGIQSSITTLTNKDSEIDAALGTIRGQIAAINGNLVTLLGKALTSLVFNPELYYQGIEAIAANTFQYYPLTFEERQLNVNANDDFSQNAPAKGTSLVSMTPALTAEYFINPSNANMPEDIKAYSFGTIKDVAYSRASDVPVPTIYKKEVKDGKVVVYANLKDGQIKNINSDNKVTVLALQVNIKSDKAENPKDTVVTSDFAALRAVNTTGIVLANAKKNNPVEYLPTTMAAAIAGDPMITVAWDNQGFNISEYIQARYNVNGAGETAWDKNAADGVVGKSSFKYSYDLIGYFAGNNNTRPSAHAALQMSEENPLACLLRPQMTKDGIQQAWGYDQSKAEIGREPIVRVLLTDEISGKIAAVGYVKVVITETPIEGSAISAPFSFTEGYTASCATADIVKSISWSQVEEQIIAKLGISKQQFEAAYVPDGVATDFNQFNNTETTATQVAADKKVGVVSFTQTDEEATETNVLKWTISAADAFKAFVDGNATSLKAIVRFVCKGNAVQGDSYAYVVFTWTPSPLNVKPEGTIDNKSKIAEYWYEAWSNNHGGYAEVHLNVAVPAEGATSSTACTFVNDLLNPFVGHKLTVSGINSVYADYQNPTTAQSFVAPAQTTATGVSGVKYTLNVSTDGKEFRAAPVGTTNYTTIAVLADDATVTYQENAVAKDILSAYGHTELAKDQTLAATIGIKAENKCQKVLPLTNNSYNVRFLRPVNFTADGAGSVKDAQNSGSSVALKDHLTFTDWRSNDPISEFKKHTNYFKYYDVASIEVGNIKSDLTVNTITAADNGNITKFVTTNLNGGNLASTKLSDIAPKMQIIYTPSSSIDLNNMGVITYYNNGDVVNKAFQVRVPLVVTYKWGFLVGHIDITVEPTIGNN